MCDGREIGVGLFLVLIVIICQLHIISPVAERWISGGCVALILDGLERVADIARPLQAEPDTGLSLGSLLADFATDGSIESPTESVAVGVFRVLVVGDGVFVILDVVGDGLVVGIQQLWC